jgi:hypothetical protein
MISEQKYRILCHCNVVPSGLKMTSETLGMSYNLMSSSMSRMVTEGLLDLEDGLYSTTPSARIEMRLYREAIARTVPAPKIDKFAGHYVPVDSYQRNGGLKHIPSRGFPC